MRGIMENRRTRMLNKISNYILYSIILIVWLTQIPNAATNCNQSFTFLLATADHNPSFWIIEDVGGEYSYSHLIQISVEDTVVTCVSISRIGYGNWKWLQENANHIISEPATELKNQNGVWSIPGLSWYIEAPPRDSILLELFQKEYYAGRERSWNELYGIKGISVPSVERINITLIYYFPEGLYVDYTISKAYYFLYSGYILVFTNQPRMASGLDTMHGFLLLKIAKESEK
jgi:hypothetical protein